MGSIVVVVVLVVLAVVGLLAVVMNLSSGDHRESKP